MKDRILEFLRRENKSSAQFADEIGVQPSGISHILSGRNNPSLDFILKMLGRYPFLSTDWLLFGKGEMYRDQQTPSLFDFPAYNEKLSVEEIEEPGSNNQEEIKPDNKPFTKSDNPAPSQQTARIVIFYDNGTFREYFPEDK
jgi:transcriptional regulator with XRE-family HTH domain